MRLSGWAMAALPLLAAGLWAQETAEETAGQAPLEPGLYASRQSFSTVVKTPPLGRRQTGITVSFALHEVTRDGEQRVADTRFCSIEPIPFGGVQSSMDEAFVAGMPSPSAVVSIEGPDGGPWTVEFEEWVIVMGADLEDPALDPLPENKKDPRVTDSDGDGKPGASVQLSGRIKGRTYVVQRLSRSMHGTLTADGHMSGTITGRAEQVTLGASNPILSRFKAVFLDETDPAHNLFDWLPVPEGTTCPELADQGETLFE